jgi:site-specific recombinase XerD
VLKGRCSWLATGGGWTCTAPPGIVRRVTRRAGITEHVSPHTLRHAFITAALAAGVPLRDVQEAASHADPRTTIRYDRARTSLDRHATYIVAAFIAGAAR